MIKIREKITKPSEMVRAMINGLRRQDEREDFHIKMDKWAGLGSLDGKPVCFGCAATCAVQELTKDPVPSEVGLLGHDIPNYPLETEDWKENLHFYEDFAVWLESQNL